MQPEPVVYVIDDDDAVRQSLEFLLRTAGFTVRGFESAKAFLEIMPELRLCKGRGRPPNGRPLREENV